MCCNPCATNTDSADETLPSVDVATAAAEPRTNPRGTLMSTIALNATDFETSIAADGIVLVDWWASWCGPCMRFGPVYEAAAAANDDIVFAKVDTEANQDLAGSANIMSIPTLMAFRDGILVFSQAGALPAAALDDLISQIRALDMDEIRAAVAAG